MSPDHRASLLARANLLAVLTIGYNLVEGLVSMARGGLGASVSRPTHSTIIMPRLAFKSAETAD